MTKWDVSIADRAGPRYGAIVRDLEEAIREGRLAPGDRLPPQRKLADALDLSLGTVTRAYEEARDRGLVEATVGRGTFVRQGADAGEGAVGARLHPDLVDLSFLTAPILDGEDWPTQLRSAVSALAERPDLADLLGYQRHEGAARHRRAGAAWMRRTGLEASPGDVLVAGSAQHAAVAALSVLTRPGDTVLAGGLTNPGLKDAASWLGLRLHGLPMDGEGLIPDAFESVCRSGVGRALYTMPTYQNPTARTMSEERRRRIAAIAAEHGVAVVEDGVHALLAGEAPSPLAAHLPDHGYFVTSHSKTLAPAVRLGYLQAPAAAHDELRSALRATMWMASPLLAEIATGWIEDGTADRLLEGRRAEARARLEVARQALGGFDTTAGVSSYHLWLELPEPWRPENFARAARRRGVAVAPPVGFVAGQVTAPRAVRLCPGSVRGREELAEGLAVLQELLDEGPGGEG